MLMCVLPVKETGTDLLSQHGVPLLLVYSPHLLWQVNETAMDAPDDEMKEVNINNMSALSTEARCACARRTRTRAQGHVYKDTCTSPQRRVHPLHGGQVRVVVWMRAGLARE